MARKGVAPSQTDVVNRAGQFKAACEELLFTKFRRAARLARAEKRRRPDASVTGGPSVRAPLPASTRRETAVGARSQGEEPPFPLSPSSGVPVPTETRSGLKTLQKTSGGSFDGSTV